MIKGNSNGFVRLRAFTLAEILTALVISSMVLVAVLGIYSRVERTADAVTRKLENSELPIEILQRIAEDLDTIVGSTLLTNIVVEGARLDHGFQTGRLVIRKSIFNDQNQEQMFEEIVWQACYDIDANSLTLYRSHSGVEQEDRLLDARRQDWENAYTFVPVCTGLTFFKLQVPMDEGFRDAWSGPSLPSGVRVTISFAEPVKTIRGILDVPDAQKIARTMAVDRTRRIGFEIATQAEEKITR